MKDEKINILFLFIWLIICAPLLVGVGLILKIDWEAIIGLAIMSLPISALIFLFLAKDKLLTIGE